MTTIAEAIAAPRRQLRGRVQILDAAGTVAGELPATSCRVSMDGSKAERWACELTVEDPAWMPRRVSDPLDPRSAVRVRPQWGVLVDGVVAWITCGTYWLDDPSIDDAAGVSLRISGHDAVAQARRGGYGGRVVSVGGMTVTAALRGLLDALSVTAYRVAESAVTLPANYQLGDGDPWDDVSDIAALAGFDVWADRDGVVVIAPPPAPDTVAASWQEGADTPVVSLSRGITTSSIRNRVVCTSTSPEVIPPVTAVVQDDDPSSPTWVGGPFGVRETRIRSDKVADAAGATNMARATFGRWIRGSEDLQVRIPARPDLEVGDLIAASSTRSGVSGLWRLQGWTLDIPTPGADPGQMTVTMRTRSLL